MLFYHKIFSKILLNYFFLRGKNSQITQKMVEFEIKFRLQGDCNQGHVFILSYRTKSS